MTNYSAEHQSNAGKSEDSFWPEKSEAFCVQCYYDVTKDGKESERFMDLFMLPLLTGVCCSTVCGVLSHTNISASSNSIHKHVCP